MMDAESLVAGDRQRRMHKKSRNGCLQCKKRHVKVFYPAILFTWWYVIDTMTQCDEQRPLCGRCVKTTQKCSLSLPAPSEHSCKCSQRAILPSNAPPPLQRDLQVLSKQNHQTQLSFTYSPRYQPLRTSDMELLHTSIRESDTFGLDPDNDIRLGFSSPYLLHIILSLSALRLYDRQPTRTDLLTRASRHQNHALSLVRPHLASLNQQNVHAVLRFAFLVSIAALGQPLYHPDAQSPHGQDPIDHLLHSFNMVRGVRFVTERQWQLSGEAHTHPHTAAPRLDDEDPFRQNLTAKFPQYRALRTLITAQTSPTNSPNPEDRLVTLDALRKVFSFVALIEANPNLHPHARLMQIWPLELDARFIEMLGARRPVALLVLGCYTALLKLRAGGAWPFGKWPGLVLRRIGEFLGREWGIYLGWAVGRVLGGGGWLGGGDCGGVGGEDHSYL
ncbi:hypothetical protein Q7P35_006716 [Cladosporium inversicolor]